MSTDDLCKASGRPLSIKTNVDMKDMLRTGGRMFVMAILASMRFLRRRKKISVT